MKQIKHNIPSYQAAAIDEVSTDILPNEGQCVRPDQTLGLSGLRNEQNCM